MAEIKGGDKLKIALEKIAQKLDSGAVLRIGFLSGSTEPDGTSIPMIAAINEYGRPDKGQPPRPFFRNMVATRSKEWPDAIAGLLKSTDYDVDKTLQITGVAIKGQLQQSILDLWSPALAESTVARKGFDKPLIESSSMVNSVDFEVKKT